MIYIYQILRQIRLDREYSVSYLASALDTTTRRINDRETTFYPMQKERLEKWLQALDIPKDDWTWYVKQHDKEVNYKLLPNNIPATLRIVLALPMTFPELLTEETILQINALLTNKALPFIPKRPRSADTIIDKLLTSQVE